MLFYRFYYEFNETYCIRNSYYFCQTHVITFLFLHLGRNISIITLVVPRLVLPILLIFTEKLFLRCSIHLPQHLRLQRFVQVSSWSAFLYMLLETLYRAQVTFYFIRATLKAFVFHMLWWFKSRLLHTLNQELFMWDFKSSQQCRLSV